MKIKTILSMLLLVLFCTICQAQSAGDFRTKQNGNWNQTSTWERFNGTSWVNAPHTPTYNDGVITIQSAHTVTVTADVQIDQTFVYGTIVINATRELRVRDGTGIDLQVYGTITNYGTLRQHTSGSPTLQYYSGAKYTHAVNGDRVEIATWNPNSTCEILGVTSSLPSNFNQTFGHLIWNCTGQTSDINLVNDVPTIQGNFSVLSTSNRHLRLSTTSTRTLNIGGSFLLSSGTFILSDGGADNTMNVNGNFSISGGTYAMSTGAGYTTLNIKGNFTMNGGSVSQNSSYNRATINFNGNSPQVFTRTAGTFYYGIHFNVKSGADVNFGSSVLGNHLYTSGNFTLESGATLRTAHSQGITTSGASGCIQVSGTRTYSVGANYQFYRSGSQPTGNGFPVALSGVLTVGALTHTTNLTLTNGSVTINNKLVLVSSIPNNSSITSGTVSYGSNGALEYQGASAQTTANAEFPSANGPRTVIVNNPHGVSLHDSRTILTALNLQQGQFSLGSNTLTLNGAVNQTSGTWAGGVGSNLVMGGTAASTNLPAITLNNFTIDRTAGIGLAGNITVHGNASMIAGNLSANGFQINYEPGAVLRYNGTTEQTAGNAEFPANNGPSTLIIENPTQVNLHANRTVSGTIFLQNGIFSIGNFTLNLPGYFQQNAGSISSGVSGHLVFEENSLPAILPSATSLAKITVNRSGGINMAGTATVNNLILSNGQFSIGSNLLTINGGITITSGALVGGDFSSITFGGSGTPTGLPEITLQNLSINRLQGINMLGNVTVKHALNLMIGPFSIGSNTLFIEGAVNVLTGNLQGGANSTMLIGENIFLWLPFDLPPVELGTLVSNRAHGVNMLGNVTVHNLLHLVNGNFHIGPHDLTINGDVQQDSGWLTSDQASGLIVGGAAPTFLSELNQLRKLEVNRQAGVMLITNLEIFDCVNLINGAIDLNGFALTYEPGCTLRYLGLAPQTTSDSEFPAINSPENVEVMNFQGVSLHENRIIEGDLRIFTGHFAIGTNTLTLNGNLFNPFFGGGLSGSPESNLIIGEGNPPGNSIFLNSIVLNNLSLNRAPGIVLNGDLDTYGSVHLENGALDVRFHKLTLRKPLSGNPDNLHASPQSRIELSGSAPGMNIGPEDNIRISVVGSLVISNTHEDGVKLNTDLEIMNNFEVEANSVFIVSPGRHLTVHDGVLITP